MTYQEAIEYVKDNYPFDHTDLMTGHAAIVRLRNKCVLLPEIGVDGSERDNSTWAYLDMTAKVDTGLYGDVYYFNDKKKVMKWVNEGSANNEAEKVS